ncbi:MAG TPA: vitamin B12-dependent ribonucleotide reductase [Terriglobales bacterium]|nr:vitamin B12-dependent ribonucleotide reductase [Terriglobales bacterium]
MADTTIKATTTQTTRTTSQPATKAAPGLKFSRTFTRAGISPYNEVEWERRTALITDAKGNTIFEQKDVESPKDWSMTAINIVASKYLHGPMGTPQRESGVRSLIERVAETIRDWGWAQGYFSTAEDRDVFHDELVHILLQQKASFNSPVWFNVGCDRLEPLSDAQNWHWLSEKGSVEFSTTGYKNPQCSACFINSVKDSLDSILTLAKTEGMLFKWGSGTGTNLSPLRGSTEELSGGGSASGPLSFMKGFDAFAGVIKSGGKTRRAAKMVILNVDHPDIVDFIECKAKEEAKAWALVEAGYDGSGPDSEAYSSIFFQNANNSVRVTDEFMQAVERDETFFTKSVKDGHPMKPHKARELLRKIAEATWQCGDPGMQYDTTVNRWHTSKNTARINASNPCSEYMFLDDSACNLASLNLMKFLKANGEFDVPAYRYAVDVLITAQEILVDNAGYPTEMIARNSHEYRPLGLGYANLGALLMASGLPYDSDTGRDYAACVTAIMCGEAYLQSARIAEQCPALGAATTRVSPQEITGGACPGWYINREPFLDVVRMHRASVNQICKGTPNKENVPANLIEGSKQCWDEALALGEKAGYRNSQVTVLAPTGTIGFMMDCDTTGIEPDLALVKYKKLVGGGMIKIVNNTVPLALWKLGYSQDQVNGIVSYIDATGTIEGAPAIKDEHYPVFDCSFKAQKGTRSIAYMGHVKMMAATQPFISGAISKTVNLPENATVEDIADAYVQSWKLGLKAVAIYRDGSKKAQPLMAAAKKEEAARRGTKGEKAPVGVVATPVSKEESAFARLTPEQQAFALEVVRLANGAAKEIQGQVYDSVRRLVGVTREEQESAPPRALRHRLPGERASITHKFSIAGHEGYITVGMYKDGTPGELFIRMAKEGSTVSGLMDSFATAVSLALQHGVPLKLLCDKFQHTRFEPSGFTGNQEIPIAKSVMDYIFRWLEIRFVSGQQFPLFPSLGGVAQPPGSPERAGFARSGVEAPSAVGAVSSQHSAVSQAPGTQAGADVHGVGTRALQPANADGTAVNEADLGGTTPPSGAVAPEVANYQVLNTKNSLHDRGLYHSADALREIVDLGDAPSCHLCGAIMTRNGSCYRCMSCGSTSGCS